MSGIYVHIPFCASRCIYCGFYSTTSLSLRDRYVGALCREMAMRRHYLSPTAAASGLPPHIINNITTLYIGGGTPSQLLPRQMERIVQCARDTFECDLKELTVECNPDDVTTEWARALHAMGANRVSMGAQTFDDRRLAFLHRRHTASQVAQAVDTLRAAGIDNISIDLMFGFPEETIDDWTADIRRALSLDVNHISAYGLMYEEGTQLWRMREQGKISEVDEEVSLAMYDKLIDMAQAAGYEHYEISNFARPGFRSLHNSSYWQDTPYIGVGAAAHSYNLASRQWNADDMRLYIEQIEQGKLPMTLETIDDDTHYDDIVTTALRTCDGLDTTTLKPKYARHLAKAAQKYIDQGLLQQCGNNIKLSRKGLYVSDMIMSDLMIV